MTQTEKEVILVQNLMNRFETDPKTHKSSLKGAITSEEMAALRTAKNLLESEGRRTAIHPASG